MLALDYNPSQTAHRFLRGGKKIIFVCIFKSDWCGDVRAGANTVDVRATCNRVLWKTCNPDSAQGGLEAKPNPPLRIQDGGLRLRLQPAWSCDRLPIPLIHSRRALLPRWKRFAACAMCEGNVTARRANHSAHANSCPALPAKNILLFRIPKSPV
jgi:hypothetical protein